MSHLSQKQNKVQRASHHARASAASATRATVPRWRSRSHLPTSARPPVLPAPARVGAATTSRGTWTIQGGNSHKQVRRLSAPVQQIDNHLGDGIVARWWKSSYLRWAGVYTLVFFCPQTFWDRKVYTAPSMMMMMMTEFLCAGRGRLAACHAGAFVCMEPLESFWRVSFGRRGIWYISAQEYSFVPGTSDLGMTGDLESGLSFPSIVKSRESY